MSSSWQETHIPHSTAHDVGLGFDPGETEWEGKGSPVNNKWQRDTECWPCETQPLLTQGRQFSTSALLLGGRPFITLYNIPHSLKLLILSKRDAVD